MLLVASSWILLTLCILGQVQKISAQKCQFSSELSVEKILPQYFGLSPYRVWFQLRQIVLFSSFPSLFPPPPSVTQRTPHGNQVVF